MTDTLATSSLLTDDVAYALETLVRVVERQSREFVASILLRSDDGTRVVDAAGPSLPAEYRHAIHGVGIGHVQWQHQPSHFWLVLATAAGGQPADPPLPPGALSPANLAKPRPAPR